MPETSLDRSDHQADRPEEVTDPLLWKLALEVADAHEPDGDGGCRNLLCAGQSWPCAAWNNAQHALSVARADTPPAPPAADREPVTGWAATAPAQRRPASRVAA
ncbi:hypothetical protein Q3W71_25890 [Micromonospora sp. C28SCA-DRY-2]|uniref:hypothetical protein n=1 Tax=Micromonospora sp. C28SCA-DRY-2 TaxID=3059522 RepID=UPI002674680D|nr:hypothetical protein [Micromonospora sp. C28SCA-DRY-2]MDO3705105.1 hypothetical protein [Micromonospora sp. C28SCA-DRY-2]